MSRLLTLAVACMIGSTLTFSQAKVTEHPTSGSGQSSPNGVRSVPNSNGSELSTSQGNAVATPSTSNQALPGTANPAHASEGHANGQAVTPKPSQSGPAGTAAGNTPTTDGNANNPEPGTTLNTAKPGAGVITTWLWAALAIVAALMLIGILMRRDRSRGTVGGPDRRTLTMTEPDRNRRDRDIRRVG